MKSRTIRTLHRWLGLLFSLTILTSTASGVLHILMTYTQAAPPTKLPPETINPASWQLPPAEVLQNLEGQDLRSIRLLSIADKPWYQVYIGEEGVPTYLDAKTGAIDSSMDAKHAEEIASSYLGGATVVQTGFLTAFNNEYLNIFRILPVYRFDAGDEKETRLYVSTKTGTVTRHTDRWKQFEASIFTNLHKFGFIPNKPLRDIVLGTVTFGAFLVSVLGIALFFATAKPRAKKT